ncbi:hypothetical protein N7489_007376 [Penicillium chrysogenum]|uniref:uncharacterized protein n=1 Tax=Penicillium chrysogenum TaxID=5076 RepID=UPI0023A4E524|nr:uncharacterized protein N7489_007376 [Penicillium chrysogenum]KAJ5237285.1 hypothetical protein N7489_007376 [Penicillium chrysogenum]KAJ5277245.1 hypothetical protein N7524_003398 [Penicillium chrysogenum]
MLSSSWHRRCLTIYGRGEGYESNLDVDGQKEQLAREKDVKLPGLKMIEGVNPRIPGFTLKEWKGQDDPEHFWGDPDDNRFDDIDDDL